MEFDTPVKEGAEPLPNMDQVIPNYAKLDVRNVVVYGIRHYDEIEKKAKYQPALALFMNERGTEPVVLNVFLHETFDDGEAMARSVVMWTNLMFGNVARLVSIFDYKDEKLVVKYDVTELFEIEAAVEELREIYKTNKYKVN
jgi:hypothetical protein